MLSNEIRRRFIRYFVDKKHEAVPSSSTIPHNDPTLLFTNAGMNQFKSFFLGDEEPAYTRAVSSQKCIRVGGKHNDLENVGHTTRHLTFFEMLGNFSFGDYFKKEAIDFAWDVTTQIFEFDLDRLWVSIYYNDEEALEYWNKHLPQSRIVRIDTDDNFWSMGELGLCGPCTELFYDKGPAFGNATSPAVDSHGERFFEFWNLVFMQYDRQSDQTLKPLPKPCVDTGAGLERIISLKMGVENIFETDLLRSLIADCENYFKINYSKQIGAHKAAFHVIVDHLRTLCFAIADGVQPSNVDRGYVLRKVLRRAVRYGRLLDAKEPFLGRFVPKVIQLMGEDYPELVQSKARICEILETEEEAFLKTLKRGGNLLSQVIEKAKDSKQHRISGEDAFKLKDTYGLPFEEIELMAKDTDLTVDYKKYQELEKKAKELSKKAHTKTAQNVSQGLYKTFLDEKGPNTFCGYETTHCSSKILGILHEGEWVDQLSEGQKGLIFLKTTPFYAEMGGQVGDQGALYAQDESLFKVHQTTSPFTDLIAHEGKVEKGALHVLDSVKAEVDASRRDRIAHNHTATHLLHWALSEVLGPHVKQAGSFVGPDRLRFDFSHHKGIDEKDIQALEKLVNQQIRKNFLVDVSEKAYREVQKDESIKQFFGDKYQEVVRIIDVGVSKELCGGIHAKRTGDIGLFKIVKEQSVAAGIRRIEALTGEEAENVVYENEELLKKLSESLKTTPIKLSEKLSQLLSDHKNLEEHNKALFKERNQSKIDQLLKVKEAFSEGHLICRKLNIPLKDLRDFTLQLLNKTQKTVVVFCAAEEDKVSLIVALTDDFDNKALSAKEIIKPLLEPLSAKGGGKQHFAQAGGSHPENIEQVFEKARDFLKQSC